MLIETPCIIQAQQVFSWMGFPYWWHLLVLLWTVCGTSTESKPKEWPQAELSQIVSVETRHLADGCIIYTISYVVIQLPCQLQLDIPLFMITILHERCKSDACSLYTFLKARSKIKSLRFSENLLIFVKNCNVISIFKK